MLKGKCRNECERDCECEHHAHEACLDVVLVANRAAERVDHLLHVVEPEPRARLPSGALTERLGHIGESMYREVCALH